MAATLSKAAAMQRFLETFGIPVYGETSDPDNASFPYMTYVMNWASYCGQKATREVDLW